VRHPIAAKNKTKACAFLGGVFPYLILTPPLKSENFSLLDVTVKVIYFIEMK
jgi:hypothetical protein